MPAPLLTRPAVIDRLRQVIDPEVGINVVDLGLVYDARIEGGQVDLDLTMTTPACPMSGYIAQEAQRALEGLPGLDDAEVWLVWQPPWSFEMMDSDVRAARFGRHR